jgi:hypothetical protein
MSIVRLSAVLIVAACEARSAPPVAVNGGPGALSFCPSTVAGARTVARPTADGVNIVITSDSQTARDEIRARAELQRGLGDPLWYAPGLSSDPRSISACPIIRNSTYIDFTPTADGAIVHVVPRDRTQVEQLQSTTEARVRALEIPAS